MKELTIQSKEIHRGTLILVNPAHPVPNQPIELVFCPHAQSGQKMEKQAAFYLSKLLCSLENKETILTVSGWRSQEEQQQIYEEARKEQGEAYAKSFVAIPGCSEHQTGLAVDLAKRAEKIDWICPSFPQEGVCETFRRKASFYGFIERYQKGKESITKIAPEEWHFRYVGTPHSEIIQEKGFALEEYLLFLQNYTQTRSYRYQKEGQREAEIFYVPVFQNGTALKLPDDAAYEYSGDNCGGIIVTVWRDFRAG